jgi:hypothetical protein
MMDWERIWRGIGVVFVVVSPPRASGERGLAQRVTQYMPFAL